MSRTQAARQSRASALVADRERHHCLGRERRARLRWRRTACHAATAASKSPVRRAIVHCCSAWMPSLVSPSATPSSCATSESTSASSKRPSASAREAARSRRSPSLRARRESRSARTPTSARVEIALVQQRVAEQVLDGDLAESIASRRRGRRPLLRPRASVRRPGGRRARPTTARAVRGDNASSSPASRAAATAASASGSATPPGARIKPVRERRERPGSHVGAIGSERRQRLAHDLGADRIARARPHARARPGTRCRPRPDAPRRRRSAASSAAASARSCAASARPPTWSASASLRKDLRAQARVVVVEDVDGLERALVEANRVFPRHAVVAPRSPLRTRTRPRAARRRRPPLPGSGARAPRPAYPGGRRGARRSCGASRTRLLVLSSSSKRLAHERVREAQTARAALDLVDELRGRPLRRDGRPPCPRRPASPPRRGSRRTRGRTPPRYGGDRWSRSKVAKAVARPRRGRLRGVRPRRARRCRPTRRRPARARRSPRGAAAPR